jgi:hypothetical protein
VKIGPVLFDRLIASTGFVGTAVFAIYLADTLGYSGSIIVQVIKDLAVSDTSRLEYLREMCYFMSVFGAIAFAGSCFYFVRRDATQTAAPIPLILPPEFAADTT